MQPYPPSMQFLKMVLPSPHPYEHDLCTLFTRHYHSRGDTKHNTPYCVPCQLFNNANKSTAHFKHTVIRNHVLIQTRAPHMYCQE